ncbi:MAG: hypothetical protein O9972_27545 [Burkholderiales bacterium]|jgi:hypothetical protein|nr:hypothetical protein [Burkholderiales bacterium]
MKQAIAATIRRIPRAFARIAAAGGEAVDVACTVGMMARDPRASDARATRVTIAEETR